jgi:type IV secretory pathway TraG/TraD family ATPase VirD4
MTARRMQSPLTGRRSYVVIDPKGELCAITSKFRSRVSSVQIINPYQLLTGESPDTPSLHDRRTD